MPAATSALVDNSAVNTHEWIAGSRDASPSGGTAFVTGRASQASSNQRSGRHIAGDIGAS